MIKSIELQNLGTLNKNKVIIKTERGLFELYFSYKTLVGFYYETEPKAWKDSKDREKYWIKKRVSENIWSTTTGKLLNELEPDKKKRVNYEQFKNEVAEMMIFLNED